MPCLKKKKRQGVAVRPRAQAGLDLGSRMMRFAVYSTTPGVPTPFSLSIALGCMVCILSLGPYSGAVLVELAIYVTLLPKYLIQVYTTTLDSTFFF